MPVGAHGKAGNPFTAPQVMGQKWTWPAQLRMYSHPLPRGLVEVGSRNGHRLHSCGGSSVRLVGNHSQMSRGSSRAAFPTPLDESSW